MTQNHFVTGGRNTLEFAFAQLDKVMGYRLYMPALVSCVRFGKTSTYATMRM